MINIWLFLGSLAFIAGLVYWLARKNAKEMQTIRELLRLEYETIANRHLESGQQKWQQIFSPLDGELKELRERIHQVYDKESRERLSLKNEIEFMLRAQTQLSTDTQSLAKALRGEAKAQGNWGEVVLEKILESSGLREGHEYVIQGRGLGLKSEAGQVLRPDVLIHLPGERHLIIDAKVSLTAYEKFIRSESASEKEAAVKEFSASLRRHIDDLASKNYAHIYGINSPDFVMLFVPTDGAFSFAHQTDPQLFITAMEKRVAVVSPSLLFPNLKTIEAIWRQDRQNRNAEEIARQGGALYDKFVGLLEDVQTLGNHLQKAEKTRLDLVSKIQSDHGTSIINRIENLRELGAKTKKRLAIEKEAQL